MNRKEFLKSSGLLLAGSMTLGLEACKGKEKDPYKELWDGVTPSNDGDYPLHDLHVHASDKFSFDDIDRVAKERHFDYYGIMFNGTRPVPATDDSIRKFFDDTKHLDCFRGMQNMRMGWTKNLSEEVYNQFDYFFMDPQMIPNGNSYGDTLEVWEHDCYVEDLEKFMEVNLNHYKAVLENPEPLDIFGWPLYLPPCVGRFYNEVWTKERLEYVLELIKKRGVALEINDFSQTPHEEFILMCKKAGIKFVFGSDSRDHRSFRMDFCKRIAKKCGLVESDFWKPEKK